jgi:ActR/RegA family two-component response regulator
MISNFLIVEDDPYWRDAYMRAAARENFSVIRVAVNLSEAEDLINEMQFSVAFVDIGLNERDDQNVDGMRVMAKIRGADDKTSIVVVTGRSGRDVLPITRDVLRKYDAFEIVGKPDIEPRDITRLLQSGLEAFQQETAAAGTKAHSALRGNLPSLTWDDQVLQAMKVTAGAQGLYAFLDELLAEFMPLVSRSTGEALSVDVATGFAHGSYWSRSVGRPIAIFFAAADRSANELEIARSQGTLLTRYQVDELLKEVAGNGLSGAVFALKGEDRGAFAGL